MFQRIIVPLDGSPCAELALPVAARIARASGGSLHLLQVISSIVEYGGVAPVPMFTEQSVRSEMARSMDYLTSLATLSTLAGIPVTTEAIFGIPARHILDIAEARGTNLIVLNSHGRTGIARWALGSVAHQLVHQSHIPLLVLREHEDTALLAHGDDAQAFRTFVPLDGSELAESALWPAAYLTAAMAAPVQGELHLVQVVKIVPTTVEVGFSERLDEEALQHARTYLETIAEHVKATTKDLNLSVTYAVEYERDVAHTLVNMTGWEGKRKAAENVSGCDLIAISTHGRSGLQRLIMGSITDRLLNATKGPMLIVRPQKVSLNAQKHEMKQKNGAPEPVLAEASSVGLL